MEIFVGVDTLRQIKSEISKWKLQTLEILNLKYTSHFYFPRLQESSTATG
jgi:hypothetical protein